MANTTIDTLLQLATPTRSGEAPGRTSESRGEFEPALKRALAADKPQDAAGARPAEARRSEEGPAPDAEEPHFAEREAPRDAAEQAESESTDGSAAETGAEADDGATDEVEISEAAEAAANAAGAQKPPLATATEAETSNLDLVKPTSDAPGATADEAQGFSSPASPDQSGKESASTSTTAANQLGAENIVEDSQPTRQRRIREDVQIQENAKDGTREGAKGIRVGASTEPPSVDDKSEAAQKAGDESKGEKARADVAATSGVQADGGNHDDRGDANNQSPTKPTATLVATAIELAPTGAKDAVDAPATDAVKPDNAANPPALTAEPRPTATLERLAAPRSILPAEPATESDGGPQVDRSRFVSRVEGAMRTAQQREGRVQVRLSPPELGALRIEMVIQNGAMTAKIEAETTTARNLLLDNLPALRERLAQQDLRVEKFDVDVRRDGGQSGGGSQDQPADQPAWRDGRHPERPATRRESSATISDLKAPAAKISDARLDVQV